MLDLAAFFRRTVYGVGARTAPSAHRFQSALAAIKQKPEAAEPVPAQIVRQLDIRYG
jgi:hypothetical protein